MNKNGIIIVNKEKDFTSHDVVNVMRKILNMKKIGHTGTLDPQATGVLPICAGKSAKVSDMLMFSDKEYVAEVKLGLVTDTEDIWGREIENRDCSHVTKDDILSAVKKFTGEIEQIPPMYSAIKIKGKKLYEYARCGVEVERKPRRVTINYIEDIRFFDGGFSMRVGCSKGTYIRTLCADIGKELGVGAVMSGLVRTKSSVFSLEDAHTIDEIRQIAEDGRIDDILIPPDKLFENLPSIDLTQSASEKILNGAFLPCNMAEGEYRVYGIGAFLCIGKIEGKLLKVVKNFYDRSDD